MSRFISKQHFIATLLLCVATTTQTGNAQDVLVSFNVAGPADWNDNLNWDPMNVPEAQYNEVALIGASRSRLC